MEIVKERLDDFKELWSTTDQNLVSKLCDIMAKEIDVQIMSDSFDLLDELITKIEKKNFA